MTIGSLLTRSATGGSLPALESSARAGASLNDFGIAAASVMTSGPSRLPMSCDPSAASGLAAAGAGAAGFAAAGAAGAAVAAGAAGAAVAAAAGAGAAGFAASAG